MDGKSIWAVSSGEYSDYGIVAVFASREIAEEFAARMNDDEYRVEEFDFYNGMPPTHVLWTVIQRVWCDNPTWESDPPDMQILSRVVVGDAPEVEVKTLPGSHGRSTVVTAVGADRERCVKSVADRIARLRAEREGIA